MEVETARAVQATYGRKKAAVSRDQDVIVEPAVSSSSPTHAFISSPTRSNHDDAMRDDDPSCNTTVSSDNEEEGEDDDEAVVMRKKPALFLSDDDDKDDDDEARAQDDVPVDVEESDAAYLKRFREARRAKLAGKEQEAMPSSSLSDPPTLSNTSLAHAHHSPHQSPSRPEGRMTGPSRLSRPHDLSLSPDLSPSPVKEADITIPATFNTSTQSQASVSYSPYVTEAQKQHEEHMRKTSRETKVKELARRRAKGNPDIIPIEGVFGEDADEEVESSTSDIQEEVEDDETLPSAMEAIQEASRKRRLADDRKKAMEEAGKASRKSKGTKAGVLQMRAEDDSDSDLDFDRSRKVTEREQPMKPLSKKEEELMHKTQARIERELKASNAKAWNTRSERPTFGLSDLLNTFEQQEGSKGQNHIKRSPGIRDADDPYNSDPIESASEGEAGKEPSLAPINVSSRLPRFTPNLKELSPDPQVDRDLRADSEDLPDEAELLKSVMIERAQKAKLEALKERKARALLQGDAVQKGKEDGGDDDDILFVDTKVGAGRSVPLLVKPLARRSMNRLGSPGGALSDEESEDDLVTNSQIHRAGKALGKSSHIATAIDTKPVKMVKGQRAHQEAPLTTEELNEKIMKKARLQNIEMRRKREAAFGKKKESQLKLEPEKGGEDVGEMVRRLKELHEQAGERGSGSGDSDADGSEYNPDASIAEDEVIDLGSADEDDEKSEIETDNESEAGSNDSEKENSAPASQEEEDSVQARMPRRPRIVIDDDENEEGDETVLGRLLSQGRSPLQPIEVAEEDDAAVEELQGTSSAAVGLLDDSSEAGFSQFFQATQAPAAHVSRPPQAVSSPPRNMSSTLGKFFEDTQVDQPLRGESFPVLSDENGESAMPGFTQLFGEGTQVVAEHNSRLMPPPNVSAKGFALLGGTDQDAFAALRKAQASEAQNLDFDADDLPSLERVGGLDEERLAALEMEALQAEMEERQSKEKKMREEANVTYINKDGFFTQTKPEYDRYSLSQSQSQSQQQSLKARWAEHGSSLDSRVEPEMPAKTRKRFRRATSIDDTEEDGKSSQLGEIPALEDDSERSTEHELRAGENAASTSKNAFEVMKDAMNFTHAQRSASPPVKAFRSRFVQGEAEESDDEEVGPVNKKHKTKKGGLDGIFSDDEGGSDEEEEEEEDGADLEELIDEEKDEKEAEKDLLARERYLKDVEADDRAALALHEKATRGGLRNKKRAPGLDGLLDGFLDDDYEEEWAERQVKNPYGNIPKKRRLQGKDGLDLLEANEETQAFVRKYRDADEVETDLDKYDFLLPAEGDEEEREETQGRRVRQDDSDDEEDGDEPQILTRRQLQDEIRERRRKRQAVGVDSDDEMEVEAQAEQEAAAAKLAEEERLMERIQREIFAHSSDDDDDDIGTTNGHAVVRDRLRENRRPANRPLQDDEDNEFTYSELSRVAETRPLSEREQERLLQLQSEYANEPEWGNQDGTRKSNNASVNGTGSSVTSFGTRRAMTKSGSSRSDLNAPSARLLHRVRSKLTGVMSRKSQFAESQDD